jgi:hypothetical protein
MSQESNIDKNTQPNVVFCRVNTSEDYYTLCRILSWGKWIYRGHENSLWHLQHSLERVIEERNSYINKLETIIFDKNDEFLFAFLEKTKDPIDDMYLNEYNAIQDYMSKTHQLNLSKIEALCNLQHYGGKTRLLDFTFSINIALYMSLENKNKFHCRCIWAINYKSLNEKLENLIIKYFVNDKTTEEKLITKFNLEGYFQNKLYHEFVKMCFYDEDSDEIPIDQDIIIPIVIPDQNPRITAQNGLFLFPTTFEPFLKCLCNTFDLKIEEDRKNNKTQKIYPDLYNKRKNINFFDGYEEFKENSEVIAEAKIIKIILSPAFEVEGEKILDASNITPYDIYPDFVGIAKSIEYWHR